MKKLLLVSSLVVVLLTGVTGTVLAGGALNATFVRFEQAGPIMPGPYYCEGYYMTAGNGIVHGWRENSQCVPYQPFITDYKVHMVFKPVSKFAEADCDDEGLIFEVPHQWTLDDMYKDMGGDQADLRDIFGQDGERYYWVCFYHWDD